MLDFLPKKLVLAEVGVYEGDFSKHLLSRADPEKLYLIDPWMFHDDLEYSRDTANSKQAEQNSRYEAVLERFRPEYQSALVSVIRKKFSDIRSELDGNPVDFIYLDAMHYYEAVYEDLNKAKSLVRKGGIIAGHDFSNHPLSARKNFGVVKAVAQFCAETEYQAIAITNERWPSYFLAEPQSSLGRMFMQNVFLSDIPVFGFPSELVGNVKQRPIQSGESEKIITEVLS